MYEGKVLYSTAFLLRPTGSYLQLKKTAIKELTAHSLHFVSTVYLPRLQCWH